MRYDLSNPNHRKLLIEHAQLEEDACPVDDICDSVPAMIVHVRSLDEKIRNLKSDNQRIAAELKEAQKKINNLKSQKFRVAKKKGKTLHN